MTALTQDSTNKQMQRRENRVLNSEYDISMCILDLNEKEKLYNILWLGKIVILRISFPIQIAIRNYLNFWTF